MKLANKVLAVVLCTIMLVFTAGCGQKDNLLPFGLEFGDSYEECVEKIAKIEGVEIIGEIEEKSLKTNYEIFGQELYSSDILITTDDAEQKLNKEYFGVQEGISSGNYIPIYFNKDKELIWLAFPFFSVDELKFEDVMEKIINKYERILNEEKYSYQDEYYYYWGKWLNDEYYISINSLKSSMENYSRDGISVGISIETRETYDIQLENLNWK